MLTSTTASNSWRSTPYPTAVPLTSGTTMADLRPGDHGNSYLGSPFANGHTKRSVPQEASTAATRVVIWSTSSARSARKMNNTSTDVRSVSALRVAGRGLYTLAGRTLTISLTPRPERIENQTRVQKKNRRGHKPHGDYSKKVGLLSCRQPTRRPPQ